MIGVERGFALEDADGTLTALPELWGAPGVRMNEGGCDPDGRFYCGSMAYDQSLGAPLCTGSTRTVPSMWCWIRVTVSNGLEWSPDGALVYYDDTATSLRSPCSTTRPSAGLTNRRTFAELPEAAARTD